MSLGFIPRRSWTTEERQAANQWFMDNIQSSNSPTLEKCKSIIKECRALQSRTPNQLKAYITNKINKKVVSSRGKGYYDYISKFLLRSLKEHILQFYKKNMHSTIIFFLGIGRKSWSTPEKEVCRRVFGEDVDRGIYPSRNRIKEAIEKYPQLNNRTPEMVVAHLQHAIKKNKDMY